jgi:serine/threonine-protein kinase
MIGSILKDRYEIVEQIGSGGMSIVYKARDRKLDRFVAIKVLKEEFLSDEDFLRRFRREAESLQRLNHPNLVATYAVQVTTPPYYIVMELVEGLTLDKILAQQKFTYEQVIYYASQMARALVHAHNNKVIHRDIKPHNMMIDSTGLLKLADFGIALTVSTSTLTNTRAIIGSVHYFSPEQAQGKPVTEQSDLYSLGIVIYEMLAGRVPFMGETPIELALKHVQEEIPPLQDFCPDLPPAIENVVIKLLEKAPEDRYESAEELLDDLESLLDAGIKPDMERPKKPKHLTVAEKVEIKRKRVVWMRRGIVAGVIISLLLLIAIAINTLLFTANGEAVKVPNVMGKSLTDAVALLDENQLNYQVLESIYDKERPEGTVLRQTPMPNAQVKTGRIVNLTISKGIELRQVPLVVGATERTAVVQLQNESFEVKVVTEQSATIPEGTVIRQVPESFKRIPVGSEVLITVSGGLEKVKVPDVRGLNVADARTSLEAVGLKLGEVGIGSDPTKPQWLITSQQPSPEVELEKGSPVHVVENQGAQTAKITITFDKDKESLIKVLVTDNYATYPIRVVYEQTHYKGDPDLVLDIPIVSPATVEVYRNGKLELSKKF